ncbi:SCO5918 family protein [Streptomyces sp. HB2AG]|uniref:SCO5918 family protein n=1 Tax=Streptomyces sp. HB2AG TaxID=2983400 RepID=UPI0022AA7D58|nr:SCO5918 family protein [Streptomyces sp. HB2AG]MCZ2527524.1 SCO5918 family protein [Streptomyces sp. HB2AG]
MRCVIAGYSFDLTASEVQQAMSGIKPEPVTGESVRIGRRTYPVKQVGAVVTRQDRRDFSAAEVTRAMRKLGFTCNPAPAPAAPEPESFLGADAFPVLPEAPAEQVLPTVPQPAAPQAPAEPSAPSSSAFFQG